MSVAQSGKDFSLYCLVRVRAQIKNQTVMGTLVIEYSTLALISLALRGSQALQFTSGVKMARYLAF